MGNLEGSNVTCATFGQTFFTSPTGNNLPIRGNPLMRRQTKPVFISFFRRRLIASNEPEDFQLL